MGKEHHLVEVSGGGIRGWDPGVGAPVSETVRQEWKSPGEELVPPLTPVPSIHQKNRT